MDEVVELQNMENVCRLCLSTDEPKLSVFETEDSLSMASKIQACLSIQVRARNILVYYVVVSCVYGILECLFPIAYVYTFRIFFLR